MWNYLLSPSEISGKFRSLVLLVAAITVLTLHALAGGAFGAIGFVQGGFACPPGNSPTTIPVTYTSAQTAGNFNVVVVGWNDTTAAVSSVTDSRGNVYTRAVGPTALAGQMSQSIYYAKNIVGAAASANTVTVRFT